MEDFAAGDDQRGKVMPARCGLYPFRRKIRPALWKNLWSSGIYGIETQVLSGGNYEYGTQRFE